VGDVLVFKKQDVIIVHRIAKVDNINGEITFITKGDNNNDIDNFTTSVKDVIGTTNVTIPYVGGPGVWLQDKIERSKK
jgi:signal peptidase